jgi:hypothetical protein
LARTVEHRNLKFVYIKVLVPGNFLSETVKALTQAMELMPFNFANEHHRQRQIQMSLKATKHG